MPRCVVLEVSLVRGVDEPAVIVATVTDGLVTAAAVLEGCPAADAKLRVAVCDVGELGDIERIVGRAELPLEQLMEDRYFCEGAAWALHALAVSGD